VGLEEHEDRSIISRKIMLFVHRYVEVVVCVPSFPIHTFPIPDSGDIVTLDPKLLKKENMSNHRRWLCCWRCRLCRLCRLCISLYLLHHLYDMREQCILLCQPAHLLYHRFGVILCHDLRQLDTLFITVHVLETESHLSRIK
jgi:hypothetical protein